MAATIHFRSNDELETLLDQEVAALKAANVPARLSNRSAVARVILMAYLTSSASERLQGPGGATLNQAAVEAGLTKAAVRELLSSVPEAAEAAVRRSLQEALKVLPEYLEEAVAGAVGAG